jgi:predicted phosphodiesterase
MPKILICGDPHGKFDHIVDHVLQEKHEAVILLGDIEASQSLEKHFSVISDFANIYWIPGNHETELESCYDNLYESELAGNNLHGKVLDICGLKVAGLGGVFRGKIWDSKEAVPNFSSPDEFVAKCGKGNLWRGGLPLRHRSSIFPSDIAIFNGCTADILVTHEAPIEHAFGSQALTNLAIHLGVKMAFHGHHHDDIVYPDGVWRGIGLQSMFTMSF